MSAPAIEVDAVLNAAIEWAHQGWSVFPCHSIAGGRCTCGKAECSRPGKHPDRAQAPHGFKDASSDEQVIRRRKWRGRNIGLVTGSGRIVIDVDAKYGAHLDQQTDGAWLLVDGYGNHVAELPASRVHRTGGGGWHWFGRANERISNAANDGKKRNLGKGIDVRGDGGYVIAPPAAHVSGGVYSVLVDCAELADVPEPILAVLRPEKQTRAANVVPMRRQPAPGYVQAALVAELDALRATAEGARNAQLNTSAFNLGQLVGGGELDRAAVESELGRVARDIGLGDDEIRATVRSGIEAGIKQPRQVPERKSRKSAPAAVPGEADREVVKLDESTRNETQRRLARHLDGVMFLRGKSDPVVLIDAKEDEETRGVQTPAGSLFLRGACPATVRALLDDRVPFVKFHGRKEEWHPTSCPKDYAAQLVDAAPMFGFRQVDGIIRAPLFDFETGKITTRRGYDARTRLIIDTIDVGQVPERPSKADCQAALNVMLSPFRGYLDRGTVSRPAVAAAALTAAMRASLETSPAVVLDGNVAGCGKGKLARALAAIAQGCAPAIITEGHNAEELEKRLSTAILAALPVVLLDNVKRPLDSPTLESGLAEGVATIRHFAVLKGSTAPWRALFLITANNIGVSVDLLRRNVPVRIVSPTANPELVAFDFDPVAEAMRDRREILRAAFTIMRGWRATGMESAPTFGSFEVWAKYVAGAVRWLTGTCPTSLIADRKANDARLNTELSIINALRTAYETGQFASSEAFGNTAIPWAEAIPEPTAMRVAGWLRSRKDRVFGEFVLRSEVDRATNKALWRFAKTSE